MSDTYPKIYRVIKRIPHGKVASYGQIARLAGMPNQARLVGYALHALRDSRDLGVPWHRVINAQGQVSLSDPDDQDLQRGLLAQEGVLFSSNGRVDMKKYGWKK
jgi:methylated-DNA-protein-cysteine methyltransferase related protein